MGNSATKEQRPPPPHFSRHLSGDRPSPSQGASPTSPSFPHSGSDRGQQIYSSRHGRSSRSELSALLGINHHNNDRDVSSLETRRETKAEREARRLERERITRERERERSMREENVDGGFLVTQGVYTGIEDYSKPMVRQLMVSRYGYNGAERY